MNFRQFALPPELCYEAEIRCIVEDCPGGMMPGFDNWNPMVPRVVRDIGEGARSSIG
jgi:hypothetical protein